MNPKRIITPTALLSANLPLIMAGQPRFGQFEDSLSAIRHQEFRLHTPFGKPANPAANWIGFKQFQYFGGMSERLIFGCALAHLRHTGIAFVYVHDLHTQQLFSRSLRIPLGVGLSMSDNPVQGESRLHFGKTDIRMGYERNPRCKTLQVRIGKEFLLEAEMPEANFEPMSICTRTAYTGWVYANKTAGLPIRGQLRYQGGHFDLGSIKAMGHHDFSCGHMRRETYWNWACFSGEVDGHHVGLNLSCGVNETSFTENCLWIDGKLIKTNLTRFEFNQQDFMQPWRVWTDDGQIDLHFTPAGQHREQLNAIVVASNFRQLFGHFNGQLQVNGRTLQVSQLPGFVEDQYTKW